MEDNKFNEIVNLIVTIFVPLLFLTLALSIILSLYYKFDENSNYKLKQAFYIIAQYLFLPFVIVFLIVNGFLILFSFLFMKRLIYVSSKNVLDLFYSVFNLKQTNTSVNIIQVKKAENEIINNKDNKDINKDSNKDSNNALPERANKYIEANNNSKSIIDNNSNNNSNQTNQLNIINIKDNNANNNSNNNIMNLNFKNQNKNNSNVNLSKKNKIIDFINNALITDNNLPSFVNLINTIKNKFKDKKEQINQNSNINKVIIN